MTRKVVLAAILACAAVLAVHAEPEKIGEDIPKTLETKHPYGASLAGRLRLVWSEVVSHPGAAYVAPHFSRFHLSQGDFVVVRSPDGSQERRYTGLGRGDLGESEDGFWSGHIKGDTAIVELWATSPSGAFGFVMDRYARGYRAEEMGLAASPESLCGIDDSTWAKCYQASEPEIYSHGRAVARLLTNGTGLCTGFLVGDAGHLLTNNHCVGSASAAVNTDYEFMAEGLTCGTSCAGQLSCPGVAVEGGTLVQTDATLDYSLILLSVNPTPTYGYLTLRTTDPSIDERIYVVGHPGGQGKKLAVASTAASDQSGFCEIFSLGTAPCVSGSAFPDIGYYCDTDGGSSGSPVLAYSDHKVVSLHHCGGCPRNNTGLHITDVIAVDLGPNVPPRVDVRPGRPVTLDRDRYGCSGTVDVEVRDDDLAGAGTTTVAVASDTEPTPETVTLAETSAGSGRFRGTLPTTALPPAGGDGFLSVEDGASITATYVDASDGSGGTNVPRTDTALADCAAPILSSVETQNVLGSQADVTFLSDEACDTVVVYGLAVNPPPSQSASSAALVTTHAIRLTGLTPCSAYRFRVSCTDSSGNTATSDNGGAYFSFQTGADTSPTYVSTSPPVAIPDNNATGAIATIQIADVNTVLDVNVELDITHTFDTDLVLSLVGPDNTTVVLSNRRPSAGGGVNFTDTVFDDQAATPISTVTVAQAPYTGSYAPDQPLGAFTGRSVTGTWKLKAVDVQGVDVGTIRRFELSFTYPPQPCGPSAVRHATALVGDACSGGGGGNGDGVWDDGEDATISVTLRNNGTVPLTNVSATIVPLTAGVVLSDDSASYPDLAVGAIAVSAFPHFVASLPEGFPCGDPVAFRVDIASDQGSFSDTTSWTAGAPYTGGGTVLDEAFTGGIPAGWTVVDGGVGGGTAATWTTANPGNRVLIAPLTAPVAGVDSYFAGSTATQDEQLVTPILDLGPGATVTLAFDQFFNWYSPSLDEKGDVDVRSSLTGGAWVNVLQNRGASSNDPDHRSLDITAQAAGASDVQIRFRYYDATWENWWQVDNVRVTYTAPGGCNATSCASLDPPGEVPSPSLRWDETKQALAWDPVAGATSYRIYRGAGSDLPNLHDDTPDSCLRSTEAAESAGGLVDVPSESSFEWWLVRAVNAAGEGPAGDGTAGPRVQDSTGACP